jgi:dTMP kinase
MTSNAKFIVICGVDGAGKSTQELKLLARMQAHGIETIVTRQPTDFYRNHPAVQELFKTGGSHASAETLALLAAADRMLHLDLVILPLLSGGTSVICNRYVYSSFGYLKERGAAPDFLQVINSRAPQPDLGIFLKIDCTEAVRRVKQRDGTEEMHYHERDSNMLDRVQEEMLRWWPDEFLLLDGEQAADVLATQIWQYVAPSYS